MSKESSIKVYAENFSGSDKPVNAIPVWIENASAISGGGGGGGSIPSNVSGKWEDASDCVQTNSASWGGGSTLPSAFVVSADGQAYKAVETAGGMADIQYQDYYGGFGITEYLRNKFENKLDNLYVISSPNDVKKLWIDFNEQGDFVQEITNGGNSITSFYIDKSKFNSGSGENALYIIGSNNVNDTYPMPDHPVNAVIQLQTESEGGTTLVPYLVSGDNNSLFTIIPGVTTNAEVNTNSANGIRLYNSADGLTYDYAGKVPHGTYDTLAFKAITGTNYYNDTQKTIRVDIVAEQNSACTIKDTNTVNLLNDYSTIPNAQTANYDSNGNYLSQTHDELTALNSFVQTNSAQWSQGGGGSDTPELLDVVFHYNFGSYNNGEIINNTQSAIDVKFNIQAQYTPSDLTIGGSTYYWNQDPDNPNYYIITTQIFPGNRLNGIPLYYSNNNTNYDSIIINNTYSGKFGDRTLTLYGKNAYFSGDNAYPYNITKAIQGSMQPITSFNGNFSYSAMTNDAIYIEVYGQDDEGIPYDTYGSFISAPEPTVTSGDVFPPTTGLTQGSKYYLAWNTNNGGLYWEYVGN